MDYKGNKRNVYTIISETLGHQQFIMDHNQLLCTFLSANCHILWHLLGAVCVILGTFSCRG